jgi:hypothetical protein
MWFYRQCESILWNGSLGYHCIEAGRFGRHPGPHFDGQYHWFRWNTHDGQHGNAVIQMTIVGDIDAAHNVLHSLEIDGEFRADDSRVTIVTRNRRVE